MKIGIIGSGVVGKTFAAKFTLLGQDAMIGTRSPEKLAGWLAENPGVKAATVSECAAHGELIILATKGDGAFAALQSAGTANLSGKILIDVTNPLDFSQGMPPSLFVGNTDSLGEQIQRAFPETKVIKAFNTLTSALMVAPRSLANGDHSLFLCGNDALAKTQVTKLFAEWFGWSDLIDVGDITSARATEALLPLWIRLYMKYGTGNLQFKIVR